MRTVHSGKSSLRFAAAASMLATMSFGTAAQDVPRTAYNKEIKEQGAAYYCANGECDAAPKLVRGETPRYPQGAVLERRSGSASVLFYIEANGRVSDVQVESASAPEFGDAAATAVRSWRYKPASLQGRPVKIGPVRQVVPFVGQPL